MEAEKGGERGGGWGPMLLFFALRWASRRRRRGPRARERRQRGGKQARPALLFPRRWGRGKNLVLLRRPSSSSLAWRSVKMPASRACLRFRGGAPDWNPQEQSERKTLSSPFSPSPSPLRLLLPLGGNNNKNSSLSLTNTIHPSLAAMQRHCTLLCGALSGIQQR